MWIIIAVNVIVIYLVKIVQNIWWRGVLAMELWGFIIFFCFEVIGLD